MVLGAFLDHGLGRSLGTVSIRSDQLRILLNTPASPIAGDAAPCPESLFAAAHPKALARARLTHR
jgi:hypothetical protein